MKMSMDTASMIDKNNRYARKPNPVDGISDLNMFNDFSGLYASDIELGKSSEPSIYGQRIHRSNVPVYSIEKHITDKINQYAP